MTMSDHQDSTICACGYEHASSFAIEGCDCGCGQMRIRLYGPEQTPLAVACFDVDDVDDLIATISDIAETVRAARSFGKIEGEA